MWMMIMITRMMTKMTRTMKSLPDCSLSLGPPVIRSPAPPAPAPAPPSPAPTPAPALLAVHHVPAPPDLLPALVSTPAPSPSSILARWGVPANSTSLHTPRHSLLYLSLLLCIYPAENIQTSADDNPSYTRECQTPHRRPAKTYFQLFLANPTDSGQWNSSPSGLELHCPPSVGVARNS